MSSAARSRLRDLGCALSCACVHVTSRVSCGCFVTAHACAARCGLYVGLYVAWSAFLVASSRGAHRLAKLLLRVPSAYLECPKEHPECQRCANALAPAHICAGTGWARPCPHLHRDSAHDCHICTGTLGHSSSSALHRRLQHGCTAYACADDQHHRWAHFRHISIGTGLTPANIGTPLPTSAPGLGSTAHISTGTGWAHPAPICAEIGWAHPAPICGCERACSSGLLSSAACRGNRGL
jgi:hypothetical protein